MDTPKLTVKFKEQETRETDPVRVSVKQKDVHADPVKIQIKN
jgi:hypothetical protein